jgi:hypothetical protein
VPDAQAAQAGAQKTLRAAEQDRPDLVAQRAAWRAEMATVDPGQLIFIDESGVDTRLTRPYARAARHRPDLKVV